MTKTQQGIRYILKQSLIAKLNSKYEKLAEKHNLALREEEGKVVIYKPKEATKTIQ